MPRNREIIFFTIEAGIFNKIKKVRFNPKPKNTEDRKTVEIQKPRVIFLDEKISQKIDNAIKKQNSSQNNNFGNVSVEIRKPCNKKPTLPEFKTDTADTINNNFNRELFEISLPLKSNIIDEEILKQNPTNFFFHKKNNEKKFSDNLPKIKVSKKRKGKNKTKIEKKNGVKKAKSELEKAKEEIERKRREIKEIERKSREKELELKKKKIEKKKKLKKLEKEKEKQDKIREKKELQIAKQKEIEKKLKEKEKKKLEKEKEKEKRQEEKEKELKEKKKEQLKIKKEKEKKKQLKSKKKQKPKTVKKDVETKKKTSFNLFKPKKEENIKEFKKTDITQEKTLVNDEELSHALDIIDDLLGELPEEKINEFASSDEFEIYEKVLKKYRKK